MNTPERITQGDTIAGRQHWHSSTRGHLASRRDTSPQHLMYPSGYDSRCIWCWLGYAHSEAAHAAGISS